MCVSALDAGWIAKTVCLLLNILPNLNFSVAPVDAMLDHCGKSFLASETNRGRWNNACASLPILSNNCIRRILGLGVAPHGEASPRSASGTNDFRRKCNTPLKENSLLR